MRVCHVTSVHARHDIRICEKECISLVKRGYDVTLVVNDADADEEYHGIHILSTGVKDSGRIRRILIAPKRILKILFEVDAECYHLHDPELLSISEKLIKAGKKVIFDAHEDTERQIGTKYWIPSFMRPVIGKIYSAYAYRKLSRMTGVISVTPVLVEKLRKYNQNVEMITNYPIIRPCIEAASDRGMSEEYIFFGGGIAEIWCHETVAEAVELVENVKYLFAGKGREEYIEKVRNKSSKAQYLGLLSHEEVMDYYKGAIAGMAVSREDTQVGKEGTLGNTKLFEVMEAGRPVICSDLKLWKEIIDKYHCGLCVNYNDISEIAEAIRFLKEHPEEAEAMGKNGRGAVEREYNWQAQAEKLCVFYEKIIGPVRLARGSTNQTMGL